ncbi:hypothetical protein ACEQ8H_006394 [Pleosporales sp. CAS-2024a]
MATTGSKKTRELLQQSEKILLHPIHPHLFAYCPTMDLIAVVTNEENLDVYRINGQLAFSLKRKSEKETIDALQWEFNGKSIAVSWSDGSMDLVNAETGKVAHKDLRLPSTAGEEDAPSRIKCIGWALNFINVDAVKRRTGVKKKSGDSDVFGQPTTEDWDAFKDDTTMEDFLSRQPDLQTLDIAPDLPDQLAMMDMESLLPKLPAIPTPPVLPFMRISQADSGAFSSQVEVDALLHSSHLRDHNSVDMLIRCSDKGTVHPSMYDSKETVNIHLPPTWNMKSTPLLHASHPYSCSHGLVMRTTSTTTQQSKLAFVPLTLNFIPSAGIYLHLIASKTSQLQNLVLYITQTLQRMRTFFKHSTDLASKFMLNISETLHEKDLGDLTTNLFHLACTGNCPALIKEWLTDELAEAGHKRWDAAVTTGLTTLLALVHEHLIPAVDRCSIIISRLRGLAEFHRDSEWIFTAPQSEFTHVLETLKKLRFLAHTVMVYGAEEKRQFAHFAKWLRFVIDFEATEPESQSRLDMEARDPGVDIIQVLDYIRHGLTDSELAPFLKLGDDKTAVESGYEDTKKAVQVLKEGGGGYREDAVCLDNVLSHLRHGITGLLKQVSTWQQANCHMDGGIVLENAHEEEGILDMKMVYKPCSPSHIATYIATCPPSTSALHIHRIALPPAVNALPRDIASYAISTLLFPARSTLVDAKFADDSHLLVLLHITDDDDDNDHHHHHNHNKLFATLLCCLPYTPDTLKSALRLEYTPLPAHVVAQTLLPDGVEVKGEGEGEDEPGGSMRVKHCVSMDMVQRYTRHVFKGRFRPLKLIVNGRKGRRVIVVLGSDCKHYRVLDMDYKRTGAGADETSGSEEEDDDDNDNHMDMSEA